MENGSKKYIWGIVIFFCGIWFVLSFDHIFSLFSISAGFYGVGMFGYNIWSLLGFLATVLLLRRMMQRTDRRLHCAAAISGFFMAAAIVYGTYAHFVNDIFQSYQIVCLQFVLMFGIAAVTVPASEEILLQFDRLCRYGRAGRCGYRNGKRYFFVVWFLIFSAYVPIFLWFWPGNFVYDAPFQLQQVLYEAYNTHHPLLHTLIMGAAYRLGLAIGDASTGFQFYTLLQMMILSASAANCVSYLYKRGVQRAYRVCVILWFMLFPMHALFSISATKDVMFAAFFLWFMIYVVRLLLDRERFRPYMYGGMVLSGVLCCLMRNNAVYAVIAGTLVILIFARRTRKQKMYVLGLLACICILTGVVNTGMKVATKAVTDDRYKETLCLELQCLARIVRYRGDEVNEEDKQEIYSYIEPGGCETYNPYLADHVKWFVREESLKDRFGDFMQLFVKMGLKFPDEYIEAWLTNTMGYWYPLDRGQYVSGNLMLYHMLITYMKYPYAEIVKRGYWSLPGVIYEPLYLYGRYMEVPVLGYLHRPDFWVWVLNYFLLWCFYRKKRDAGLTGAIPLLYLCTCYLGPVSHLRYIYCLVVTVPLIGYVVMRSEGENAGLYTL